MQEYLKELSQYAKIQMNLNEESEYLHFDSYWEEGSRFPYLFFKDGSVIGFALINGHTEVIESGFSIADFMFFQSLEGWVLVSAVHKLLSVCSEDIGRLSSSKPIFQPSNSGEK